MGFTFLIARTPRLGFKSAPARIYCIGFTLIFLFAVAKISSAGMVYQFISFLPCIRCVLMFLNCVFAADASPAYG